jgi:hypothetical protein
LNLTKRRQWFRSQQSGRLLLQASGTRPQHDSADRTDLQGDTDSCLEEADGPTIVFSVDRGLTGVQLDRPAHLELCFVERHSRPSIP